MMICYRSSSIKYVFLSMHFRYTNQATSIFQTESFHPSAVFRFPELFVGKNAKRLVNLLHADTRQP